jgi:hypothetical protein
MFLKHSRLLTYNPYQPPGYFIQAFKNSQIVAGQMILYEKFRLSPFFRDP